MKISRYINTFPGDYLFAILLGSFALRVVNLNYNSPFLDEAIYIVFGRRILSGTWEAATPFSWLGGYPFLYPPLTALFGVFGIVGSRFLSVIFGTISVYLMYLFAKNLNLAPDAGHNERVGLYSATLAGMLAVPVYLSRFATYDMLSYTLLGAGVVMTLTAMHMHQPDMWRRETRFFFAAGLLFLSFLAKYITLLFFPFIVLWTIYQSRKIGFDARIGSVWYFAAPLAGAVVFYVLWHMPALLRFYTDQVGTTQDSALAIVMEFIGSSIPVIILATVGAAITIRQRRYATFFFLVCAAFIVPAVQALTGTANSVQQHVYLLIWFLLPLSGYGIVMLFHKKRVLFRWVTAVVLVTIGVDSGSQLHELETSWTNTTAIMAYLRSHTSPQDKILSSEGDITTLALDTIPREQITGFYNFDYQGISDIPAYRRALEDAYFDVLLISQNDQRGVLAAIQDVLPARYTIIHADYPFAIYRRPKNPEKSY